MRTTPFISALSFGLALSSLSADARATVLLRDDFNAPDGTDLNAALATRQSGSLTPVTYGTSGAGISAISGGRLLVDQSVYLQHDFVDAAITASGGMVITFDLDPFADHAGPQTSDWSGIAFGKTLAGAQGSFWGPAGDVDVWLRESGTIGWDNPTVSQSNGILAPPSSGAHVFSVRIELRFASFTNGSAGTADIWLDGAYVLGGGPFSFTWDADGTNYIQLVSIFQTGGGPGAIDNLVIETLPGAIPEPALTALSGAGAISVGVALRRARRSGRT